MVDRANEGVQVYVMIWSEITSVEAIGMEGVMGTHDTETYNYFKDTEVKVTKLF